MRIITDRPLGACSGHKANCDTDFPRRQGMLGTLVIHLRILGDERGQSFVIEFRSRRSTRSLWHMRDLLNGHPRVNIKVAKYTCS